MVPRSQKWLIVLILVAVGGTLLVVIFDRAPALPAVMMLPATPLVVKSGRLPDRWIPRKWTWLQRACLFVLGQPRQAGFYIRGFEASGSVASFVAQNSPGTPQAQSDGATVWILRDETRLRHKTATNMGSGKMLTLDQTRARISLGTYSVDVFPCLESETIDLSTRIFVAIGRQTNFVAALRVQLPYGQTLLVLDVRHPDLAANRYEFLITADEYDAAGNKLHGKTGVESHAPR